MSQVAHLPLNVGAVWRADTLAQAVGAVVGTGHGALNAQLPGGGWPVGALVEILQDSGQHLEWQLLLPALAALQTGTRKQVLVLVGAPHAPFGPGLAGRGLHPQSLLRVDALSAQERLWAAEQALHCADVAAVLAWLPQARSDQLRRLQMAAAQHQRLLVVMRPAQVQTQATPAALRLHVMPGPAHEQASINPAPISLRALSVLKRRGPPLTQPVPVVSGPARLVALLACARSTANAGRGDALAPALCRPQPVVSYALDRFSERC